MVTSSPFVRIVRPISPFHTGSWRIGSICDGRDENIRTCRIHDAYTSPFTTMAGCHYFARHGESTFKEVMVVVMTYPWTDLRGRVYSYTRGFVDDGFYTSEFDDTSCAILKTLKASTITSLWECKFTKASSQLVLLKTTPYVCPRSGCRFMRFRGCHLLSAAVAGSTRPTSYC